MAAWYQNLFWFIVIKTKVKKLWKYHNVVPVFHDEFPEPPFILMANHSHAQDPYIMGGYMKHTVHFMANIDGVSDVERLLSHLVAAYGKKKGAPDFASLRKTIELLKSGEPVGIFPEGDRSWDGETAPFIPGTMSIAKKYGIPLIVAAQRGNYLSEPRWADNPRQGKLRIDYHVIGKEEIGKSSLDELEKKVWDLLYINDVKDPLNRETIFTGTDLAAGIQRLLWICPSCASQDSLNGEGDDIVCSHCGSRWTLEGSLKFNPAGKQGEDLKDWYDWQKGELRGVCQRAGEKLITETKGVLWSEIVTRKMTDPVTGDLKLYRDRVVLSAPDREDLVLERRQVDHYIDNFNKAFEFDCGGKRYRIIFDGKNAVKWLDILNYLKKVD